MPAENERFSIHLQSIDDPEYGFMVSDPNIFDSEYTVPVDAGTRKSLQLEDEDEIVVMTIVTVKDKGNRITGNLLGPVVVNATKRIGCQLVLDPGVYKTETPLTVLKNDEQPVKETVGASV